MRTRSTLLASAALLVVGVGFAANSVRSVEPSASAEQRPAVSAPQKPAATSMVVYKSPT